MMMLDSQVFREDVRRVFTWFLCLVVSLACFACDDILDVEDPKDRIPVGLIFEDDNTAISAVTGIYATMVGLESFSSGGVTSVTSVAGLSADELADSNPGGGSLDEFYRNELRPPNVTIKVIWSSAYKVIYQTNSILEALNGVNSVSQSVKEQLMGEVLFARAFVYFNLVNLYGEIPLLLETDYRSNTRAPRSPVDAIYEQIVADLQRSVSLLKDAYPSNGRVRPNKATAASFLARVYLFRGNWVNAQTYSSMVIEDSRYVLPPLAEAFLVSSTEAIWQLQNANPFNNTWEGNLFVLDSYPQSVELTDQLYNAFEEGDLRKDQWVGVFNPGDRDVYYPNKYKVKYGGPASQPPVEVTEYSVVFRLAEQYLIRAEARCRQNNLSGAIADVDSVRARAGLPLISDTNPGIGTDDLLAGILSERRIELFSEWGHRWFDLKRLDKADEVLGALKQSWESTDVLYPIPQSEFSLNPGLGDQNHGY